MALQTAYGAHDRGYGAQRRDRRREGHDLTLLFWSIATPACLAFWAAVAYGIHSAL